MTIIFQIAAVVVILVAAIFVLRDGGARHQAIRRILLGLFIVAAAIAVFFPQVLSFVAGLVGIGRGADLLLYITVLAFLSFVATTYRRFRRMEADITELSRRLALAAPYRADEHRGEPGESPTERS